MREQNYNALNFSYLLLDFYKEMNITEDDLAVILMVDHLIEQGNGLITTDMLVLKMNLTSQKIDSSMTNLYKKKYIEFIDNGKEMKTSLEPLKRIIYKKFEKTLFSDEEIKENKEFNEKRDYLFALFAKEFNRELSPFELSHVDNWVKQGIDTDIIVNSLKDAVNQNKLSINYVDSLIVRKIQNDQ